MQKIDLNWIDWVISKWTLAHLQVRLPSFFVLKLTVCSLQNVDGGLAGVNSQSWKKGQSCPLGVFHSDGGSYEGISYVGPWTPCVMQCWRCLQKDSSEASCVPPLLPHTDLHKKNAEFTQIIRANSFSKLFLFSPSLTHFVWLCIFNVLHQTPVCKI